MLSHISHPCECFSGMVTRDNLSDKFVWLVSPMLIGIISQLISNRVIQNSLQDKLWYSRHQHQHWLSVHTIITSETKMQQLIFWELWKAVIGEKDIYYESPSWCIWLSAKCDIWGQGEIWQLTDFCVWNHIPDTQFQASA